MPTTDVTTTRMNPMAVYRGPEKENVISGALWMVGVSLLLFWLPVLNGFIGGLVGGYKVGGVRRALIAAVLPAVAVSLGLWILLTVLSLPVLGFVAGLTVFAVVLLADIGLFLGAAIGGAAAENKIRRRVTV